MTTAPMVTTPTKSMVLMTMLLMLKIIDKICDPVSLTSPSLIKLTPDQSGFIVNLKTLCCELQKDVYFDFTENCEEKLFEFSKVCTFQCT